MFKKKEKAKKIVDKSSHLVVSSDSAYIQSAKALNEALKIARFNRDLEAIIAISDRWTQLARLLEPEDDRTPLGFTMGNEEKNEHNHG
jgi:hypothetical protein